MDRSQEVIDRVCGYCMNPECEPRINPCEGLRRALQEDSVPQERACQDCINKSYLGTCPTGWACFDSGNC